MFSDFVLITYLPAFFFSSLCYVFVQRFFAVIGQTLSYYASEEDVYREDGDEIGGIDLRTVSELQYPSADASVTTSHPYSFDMVAGERVWCLGANDQDDLEAWMRAICTSTNRLQIKVTVEGGVKKITTTNPKAKLENRLGFYGKKKKGGGKKKKIGGRGKRSSVKPGQMNMSALAPQETKE
jgi:hypothetical protein